MKKRKDLTLRKIGKQYMIVENSENTINLTNVYTLNGTAAYLWEKIGEEEFTREQLTAWICERYEIDETTASEDVRTLVQEWVELGLVNV